jgi:hypothetical protein
MGEIAMKKMAFCPMFIFFRFSFSELVPGIAAQGHIISLRNNN